MSFSVATGFVGSFLMNPFVPWAPTDIGSGLKAWFRADLGITKDGGDLVSLWSDQSGNGNDIAQDTGTNQGLWIESEATLNGQSCIQLNGSDNFFDPTTLAGGTEAQPFWCYAICSSSDVDNASYILENQDSSPRIIMLTEDIGQCRFYGSTYVNSDNGVIIDDDAFLYRAYWNGASSEGKVWRDGSSATWTGDSGTNSLEGIVVGARYDGGIRWYLGKIAELIIGTGDPSGFESNLLSYAETRYGFTSA